MIQFARSNSTKVDAFHNEPNVRNNGRRLPGSTRMLALAVMFVSCTGLYGENRVAERKVPPIYPAAAKALRHGGTVKVTVTISAAGAVTKAEAKGANRLLSDAAEDAVRKWKFAAADSETTQEVEIIFKVD